jgi:hypothetical protein
MKLGRHDWAQMSGVYAWVLETQQTRPGPDVWGIYLGIRNMADTTGPDEWGIYLGI